MSCTQFPQCAALVVHQTRRVMEALCLCSHGDKLLHLLSRRQTLDGLKGGQKEKAEGVSGKVMCEQRDNEKE